ncbi:MAG TPA: hypothetical protein VFI11_10290 [Anaerolineales bacterium]|nr:hypothetical protein [Anaerolineales bacterium]
MSRTRILPGLILFALTSAACGGASPTPGPGLTPLASSPTATAEAVAPIALSLSEAVLAGAEAGQWSEAEGLIRGLRYLVGELSHTEAFDGAPLLNGEGTGVIRLAQAGLAKGELDEADREEIERLLAILLPSRETLERLSQPAASSRPASGMAAPAPRPSRVDCQELWASGFSLPFPVRCLEFEELAVGGRTYRVYYPSYWAEGDERRGLLAPAFEALEASIGAYNGYGPEPVFSTDIVFTELESLAFDSRTGEVERDPDTGLPYRDPDVYAAAITAPEGNRCLVGVFPAAVDLALAGGEGAFQQTIAHELFHCYQYTNLSEEESGPARAATEWWVEGSAEFFGAVIYPGANNEFQYLEGFRNRSTRHSLLTLSYHAYPFFQYLAVQNGLGPDGVIQVLRAMPEAGGLEDQQTALAGLSGIEDAFHEFGRAYLDRQLQDYGGGTLPLEPGEGALASFGIGEGEGYFSAVGPFQLKHYRMRFAENARFRNNPTIEGTGKVGARAASAVGAWGQVPTDLNTACGEPEYVLLVTGAVPPGTDPVVLTLATLGEEVDEEIGCDECVVGTWQLSNASYLRHMGGLWPTVVGMMPAYGLSTEGAEVHPTEVFGSMTLTFKPDGTAEGQQFGWGIAGEGTRDGTTVEARVAYEGWGEAAWHIETNPSTLEDYLLFEGGEFDILSQMVFMGFTLDPRPTGGSNDTIFLSSPQPFLCDVATLTYSPEDPNGPIVFLRVPPEAAGP